MALVELVVLHPLHLQVPLYIVVVRDDNLAAGGLQGVPLAWALILQVLGVVDGVAGVLLELVGEAEVLEGDLVLDYFAGMRILSLLQLLLQLRQALICGFMNKSCHFPYL